MPSTMATGSSPTRGERTYAAAGQSASPAEGVARSHPARSLLNRNNIRFAVALIRLALQTAMPHERMRILAALARPHRVRIKLFGQRMLTAYRSKLAAPDHRIASTTYGGLTPSVDDSPRRRRRSLVSNDPFTGDQRPR